MLLCSKYWVYVSNLWLWKVEIHEYWTNWRYLLDYFLHWFVFVMIGWIVVLNCIVGEFDWWESCRPSYSQLRKMSSSNSDLWPTGKLGFISNFFNFYNNGTEAEIQLPLKRSFRFQRRFSNPSWLVWGRASRHQKLAPTFPGIDSCLMVTKRDFLEMEVSLWLNGRSQNVAKGWLPT